MLTVTLNKAELLTEQIDENPTYGLFMLASVFVSCADSDVPTAPYH